MTQIRRERDISEGELTDWIADLFGRMQDRIDALENPANPSPYRLLENDETAAQAKSFPPGRTIDGQTKPK